MSRESKCKHDIDEQETAVAEHLCPLCLDDRLESMRLSVLETIEYLNGLDDWAATGYACDLRKAMKEKSDE